MPSLQDLERLAAGHGVAFAVLVCACIILLLAVRALWNENQALYTRMQQVLEARSEIFEKLMWEERRDRTVRRVDQ